MSVEFEITEAMLTGGWLQLGPRQTEDLGLPRHREERPLRFGEIKLDVQWDAARRRLGGETFAEELQMATAIGQIARLWVEADVLHLSVSQVRSRFDGHRTTDRTRPTFWDQTRGSGSDRSERPSRRSRKGRTVSARHALRTREDHDFVDGIGVFRPSVTRVVQQVREGGWDPQDMVDLRVEMEQLATTADWDHLLAIDLAHVDRFWWQEAAARRTLKELGGRAVLADEVGLGKTIEAGLVIKELQLRGLVRTALILTPGSLREQWREELSEKFDIEFTTMLPPIDHSLWDSEDRLIATRMAAVQSRERLMERKWDLVVVDEAHNITGKGAKATRELMLGLDTRYMLFLTATPVQNDLEELYRLISYLRPGTFSSLAQFKRDFVNPTRPREPRDPEKLRTLVKDVMVRTTREQAGIDKVTRTVRDAPVRLSSAEQGLYEEVRDALRTVMTDSSDGARRRFLAHRLASSPKNLARTALRMADQVSSPRAADALRSIARRAADITDSSREQTAVREIKASLEWQRLEWPGESPRVLVFTQQTDTVTALMGALDTEGIEAEPFHGGMTQKRRAAAIKRFLAGEVPVLLSTSAGAEGHNLQACNVVLNYDLPWNPMRLEQQIGRVHRVTQHRDVHVVNMFALGTVEEQIYGLLKEKLRMFELLFGQITTILGEMGDRDSASTFEQRLFDALYARDDHDMQRRFDRLGDELAQARSRSATAIDSSLSISAWLSPDDDHRQQIPAGGARTLMPDRVDVDDEARRDRTERIARRVIGALGGHIEREQRGFLSALVDGEAAEELQRDELHLAFSRTGLDEHLDAELCAPGSEVFEELLEAMRARGDLRATVPVWPEIGQEATRPHADDLMLESRELLPPASFWGRAAVKAVFPGGTEKVCWVDFAEGSGGADRVPRHHLEDGESLESQGPPDTQQVLDRVVVPTVRTELEPDLREHARRMNAASSDERRRQVEFYDQQIEATWDPEELRQLQAARRAAQMRPAPTPEVRVEILAMTLDVGDDFTVLERWRTGDDRVVEITVDWQPDEQHHYVAADGSGVAVLAVCSDDHVVDESRRSHCSSCDRWSCRTCAPERLRQGQCRLCDRTVCGQCETTRHFCEQCREPERRPELDGDGTVAHELGDGLVVQVSARGAVVMRGSQVRTVVLDPELLAQRGRTKLVPHLIQRGLPPDAALTSTSARSRAVEGVLTERLDSRATFVEVAPDGTVTHDIADDALGLLGEAAGPDLALVEDPIGGLVDALRRRTPPPPSPVLHARVDMTARRVVLTDHGLDAVLDVSTPDEDDRREVVESAVWEPAGPVLLEDGGMLIGTVDLRDVHLSAFRYNRSHLVTARIADRSENWFIPADDDATAAVELALAEVLHRRTDLPSGAAVAIDPDGLTAGPPTPAEGADDVELAHRQVEPRLVLLPSATTGEPVTAGHLDAIGLPLSPDRPGTPPIADGGLRAALQALGSEPETVVLGAAHRIRETWRGRTEATVEFDVRAFQDELVPTADGGLTGVVDVDDFGHVTTSSDTAWCRACERTSCPGCGATGVLQACATCGQDACGFCRDRGEPPVVEAGACALCGWTACDTCGQDPRTVPCRSCLRSTCRSCIALDQICGTCVRATGSTTAADLPASLQSGFCAAGDAQDQVHRIVRLVGHGREEIAVLDGGRVVDWVSHRWSPDLPLRIRAARHFQVPDVRLCSIVDPDPTAPAATALTIHHDVRQGLEWVLTDPDGAVLHASGGRVRGAAVNGVPESRLTATTDALGLSSGDPVPRPSGRPEPTMAGHVDLQDPRPVLTVHVTSEQNSAWVDTDGLHIRDTTGSDGFRWRPDATPAWAFEDWSHLPPRVPVLRSPLVEMVIVRAGDCGAVGIRRQGAPHDWFRMDHGDDTVGFAELAIGLTLLGEPVMAGVSALVLPEEVKGPTILGARMISRSHVTKVQRVVGPAPLDDLTRDTVDIMVPGFRAPALQDPTEWSRALTSVAFDRVSRATIDVGLSVEERWERPPHWTTIHFELSGGSTLGTVRTDDHPAPLSEARLDRQGHVVHRAVPCPYCKKWSCEGCEVRVQGCAVCGQPVCAACAADGRCAACSSLIRWTRGRAKEEGLQPGWFKRVLGGADSLHHVTAEETADGFLVRGGPVEVLHPSGSPIHQALATT